MLNEWSNSPSAAKADDDYFDIDNSPSEAQSCTWFPGPKKDEEEESKEKSSKQSSIATFLKKESPREILSMLATCNGFSIYAICKSDFIRKSLTARQFELPKSETAIMKLIRQKCEVIEAELKSNLNKKENVRFSVSMNK